LNSAEHASLSLCETQEHPIVNPGLNDTSSADFSVRCEIKRAGTWNCTRDENVDTFAGHIEQPALYQSIGVWCGDPALALCDGRPGCHEV